MARRPGTGRRAIALLSLLVVATLLPGPAAHAAIDRPPNRLGSARLCRSDSQATQRGQDDVRRKLAFDLEYIGRRSLTEDLRIMLRTLPVVAGRFGGW